MESAALTPSSSGSITTMMVAILPKRLLLGNGCAQINPMNGPSLHVALCCHHMSLWRGQSCAWLLGSLLRLFLR